VRVKFNNATRTINKRAGTNGTAEGNGKRRHQQGTHGITARRGNVTNGISNGTQYETIGVANTEQNRQRHQATEQ